MKRMKFLLSLILTVAFAFTFMVSFSTVANAGYNYEVEVILGGTGDEGAAFAAGLSDKLSGDKTTVTFKNLSYGDEFVFDPKSAVTISPVTKTDDAGNEVTYSKYYVKGIRRSGSNELSPSAITITQDETFVIAYGVGEVVPYTVKFVDKSGNNLLAPATYYGAKGEEVYVPYRYIDGYVLDASCKANGHINALKENQEVIFVYTKQTVGTKTVYNTTENTTYSTVTGNPEYIYQVVPSAANADNAGVTNNRNQAGGQNRADDAQNQTAQEGDDNDGDATEIGEPSVPASGGQNVVEIDGTEPPKSGGDTDIIGKYIRYLIVIALIGILIILTSIIGTYKIEHDKNRKN